MVETLTATFPSLVTNHRELSAALVADGLKSKCPDIAFAEAT